MNYELLNCNQNVIEIKYWQALDSYIYANDNYYFYFKITF